MYVFFMICKHNSVINISRQLYVEKNIHRWKSHLVAAFSVINIVPVLLTNILLFKKKQLLICDLIHSVFLLWAAKHEEQNSVVYFEELFKKKILLHLFLSLPFEATGGIPVIFTRFGWGMVKGWLIWLVERARSAQRVSTHKRGPP